MLLVRRARRWALRKLICKIVRHDESKTIHVKVICFWIHYGCIILHTMFYNAVHLHMQYYSFANTILKCAAFQFFTPARKPTVNFYPLSARRLRPLRWEMNCCHYPLSARRLRPLRWEMNCCHYPLDIVF